MSMSQANARRYATAFRARGRHAIATTEDELAHRWERTHEWLVVLGTDGDPDHQVIRDTVTARRLLDETPLRPGATS